MILSVTTCGTSIFTNMASGDDRSFLTDSANKLQNEYSGDDISRLQSIAQQRRKFMLHERDEVNLRKKSAELNGLIGYYRKNGFDPKNHSHLLICSDTYQGELAAQVIQDWGKSNGYNMTIYKVPDLNTRDLELFRFGINNLVDWCEEIITGYRSSKYKVIFNLVGGFKILQGYMQTLGMFYADESVYIFEGSDKILSIPRMPIDFSENFKAKLKDNINLVRTLKWKSLKNSECAGIPEAMLEIIGDECTLSTWGKLMFNRTRDEIYSERLLPSPTRLIKYSEKTERIAKDLDKGRRVELNTKIDDLAYFLEVGRRQPTSSLDLKALKGNPKPPSTHEFDLWSNKDVWRGYGYFDNVTFIINEIGDALHN